MSAAPFVCQRCKQPLRIHESLTDLSPAAIDLLTGKAVVEGLICRKQQLKQLQDIDSHKTCPVPL
jgi:hypothetical protein